VTVDRRTILIASGNAHKIEEIQAIFADAPFDFITPADVDHVPDVEETGTTFEANAILKASGASIACGCWALADDSGIEVDALGGAPGVISARYAGDACDDEANNDKLLAELEGVPDLERTGRFRAVVVICDGDTVVAKGEGVIEGQIGHERKGDNGFGYDPLFYVPSEGCTSAELPPEEKNAISHRAQALQELLAELTAAGLC
jgi:XTP/dITP diphosphohydrolase